MPKEFQPIPNPTGFNPKQYNVILANPALQLIKPYFYGKEQPVQPVPVGKSYLGTYVFDNLTILGGSYLDNQGNKITYGELDQPYLTVNTVLINVTMTKNIVKTPLAGADGTVKEYISDGDFDVAINGVLISPNDNIYPEEDNNKLKQLCLAKASIKVVSNYLQRYDIHNLVIENYSYIMREGFQNIQEFTLQTISDNPLIVQLGE